MIVRKCSLEDLDDLDVFFDQVMKHLIRTVNYPKWIEGVYPARETIRQAIRAEEQYVCLDGARVAGAFVLNADPQGDYSVGEWQQPLQEGEYAVIHTLAADPEMAGRGVGRFMVEEALRLAEAEGYRAIRLDVVPDNVPACRLYERCGFTYVGEKDLKRGFENIPTFALYERNF